VTGSQNAYAEFLHSEKVMYANPNRINEALSAYRLGEKSIADVSNALFTYRVSEKTLYTVNALSAALSAHHLGEKMIVSFDVCEAALLNWWPGEKAAR
jgi:hypothetical protein